VREDNPGLRAVHLSEADLARCWNRKLRTTKAGTLLPVQSACIRGKADGEHETDAQRAVRLEGKPTAFLKPHCFLENHTHFLFVICPSGVTSTCRTPVAKG